MLAPLPSNLAPWAIQLPIVAICVPVNAAPFFGIRWFAFVAAIRSINGLAFGLPARIAGPLAPPRVKPANVSSRSRPDALAA